MAPREVDVILRNGSLYDGTGRPPVRGDVAIQGDVIAAVGSLGSMEGRTEIDVGGWAVAPGFINMLSWATESLWEDGRSLSDLVQGVTLEVFGEGRSMAPLNDAMKQEMVRHQGDIRFPVNWTTLGEYLEGLVARGVSTNVASFVGATTVRIHVLGYADRSPDPDELQQMQELVRQAMREGALGVGSSLIYAPAAYATTRELTALAAAAGESGGLYISHLRSEGNRLLEAVDELIAIARAAGLPAEIYHLKVAGSSNWAKLGAAIERIEAARSQGLRITADMYPYTAGATGLDAMMPPWVQEGGQEAWERRLQDAGVRRRLRAEMSGPSEGWENFYQMAGSADKILLTGFKNPALKPLTGRTLAQVAAARGRPPEETAMDLVVEDGSRVEAIYFLMSEENIRRQMALPWMSFCSDAASRAPEGVFLRSSAHPRAYGTFARLLGHYVREERILSLQEAIRRLTSLPADHLGLTRRGRLQANAFADLVVFDPATIQDHATYTDPHRLATGVKHVFVNGVQVLKDGQPTGARPGRVVHGPGWQGRPPQ